MMRARTSVALLAILHVAVFAVLAAHFGSAPGTRSAPIIASQPLDRVRAKEPVLVSQCPQGTRSVSVRVARVKKPIPVGLAIDVVGESTEPGEIGKAILNVRLLAFDCEGCYPQQPIERGLMETEVVAVALTPTQWAALSLMCGRGMKLSIRPHAKVSPER